MKIPFDVKMLTSGASLLEQEKDSTLLKLSKDGAGIVLPWDVMKMSATLCLRLRHLRNIVMLSMCMCMARMMSQR